MTRRALVQATQDARNASEAQSVVVDTRPQGHKQGLTGPVGYWHVDDIKTSLKQLVESGAQVQQKVKDVGGGKLIAIAPSPELFVVRALCKRTPYRSSSRRG